MFKPPLHNLCAALRDQAANFRDLGGLEAVIESHGEVVKPDLALVTGLEDMHVNPLSQVIALKADPIPILNEHRRHGQEAISTRPGIQMQNSPPSNASVTHHGQRANCLARLGRI